MGRYRGNLLNNEAKVRLQLAGPDRMVYSQALIEIASYLMYQLIHKSVQVREVSQQTRTSPSAVHMTCGLLLKTSNGPDQCSEL